MKKILPFLIIVIILLLFAAILRMVSLQKGDVDTTSEATPEVVAQFPVEIFTGQVPVPPPQASKLTLKAKNGNVIQVSDFRTLPKVKNIGEGFHHLNGQDPNVNLPYSILYSEIDSSLVVSLDASPLSVARKNLSYDLLQMLDITEEEACNLNIDVGVTYDVDEDLAGQNLGLSFCSDSVPLP